MVAVPEAQQEVAIPEAPYAYSSLLSDEVFREPATTGELLPNGRKLYRAWARMRKEDIEQRENAAIAMGIELGNSGSETETETDGTHYYPSEPRRRTAPSYDEIHQMIDIVFTSDDFSPSEKKSLLKVKPEMWLRTTDLFPSKYMVDSDDDEKDKPRDSSLSLLSRAAKKPRKSVLFSSDRPQSCIDKEKITVPPNASGIVDVMGRRVHADRLIHGNASLYSMLRAWVHDDPEEIFYPTETNVPASAPRKTLMDYQNMQSRKKPLREQESANKRLSDFDIPPPSMDLLGWLTTNPALRKHALYTPNYPTMEEMREVKKKRIDKQASRRLRKQKLAAARKSLRRKGINV